MQPLTEEQVRAVFVNAAPDELERLALPLDFILLDWDHLDFFAWRDPRMKGRGYVIAELSGTPTGVVLRATDGSSRGRPAMCNLCHTMQPGDQVALFTARRVGDAGSRGEGGSAFPRSHTGQGVAERRSRRFPRQAASFSTTPRNPLSFRGRDALTTPTVELPHHQPIRVTVAEHPQGVAGSGAFLSAADAVVDLFPTTASPRRWASAVKSAR